MMMTDNTHATTQQNKAKANKQKKKGLIIIVGGGDSSRTRRVLDSNGEFDVVQVEDVVGAALGSGAARALVVFGDDGVVVLEEIDGELFVDGLGVGVGEEAGPADGLDGALADGVGRQGDLVLRFGREAAGLFGGAGVSDERQSKGGRRVERKSLPEVGVGRGRRVEEVVFVEGGRRDVGAHGLVVEGADCRVIAGHGKDVLRESVHQQSLRVEDGRRLDRAGGLGA
mmetsp:Transcript_9897/g.29984  ORF Transcript_9897/g.29984 Transcript_9897/m.29984 type:complete len:227 (-) Transcript_9897:1545-2225(-)